MQTQQSHQPAAEPRHRTNSSNEGSERFDHLLPYAWIPIPLFLALLGFSWVIPSTPTPTPILLFRTILNFAFGTVILLWVSFLAARSFRQNGSVSILLFGSGLLLFATSNFLAGVVYNFFRLPHQGMTLYLFGLFLTSVIHFVVAAFVGIAGTQIVSQPRKVLHLSYLWVIVAVLCYSTAILMGWTALFIGEGELPVFLRRQLLLVAVAAFGFSAIVIVRISNRQMWNFGKWYGYALALFGTGVFGTFFSPDIGTSTEWIARAALYLGCLYFVPAGITALSDNRAWNVMAFSRLQTSEERFRAIAEATFEGILFTLDGRIVDANLQAAEMLGYERWELLGKSVIELVPTDHSEIVCNFLKNASEESVEHRIGRKDGTELVAECRIRELPHLDKTMQIIFLQDVTERREQERALRDSESRLRSLFENMSEGFVIGEPVFDDSGNVSDVMYLQTNPAFRRQTGFSGEITGKPLKTFLPDLEPEWIERFSRVITTEKAEQFELFNRDTNRYYDAVSFSPENGKFAVLLRDITKRKKIEHDLAEDRDKLEEAVRERTAELEQRAFQLARLASELTLAEDRERRRLAQFLHDDLQQLLVGAKYRLYRLAREFPPERQEGFSGVEELIDQSIEASRSLTAELSPPILHEAGLAAGLGWLARWMKQMHDLKVELDIDESLKVEREDLRLFLFQAVKELLLNIVKHGQTDQAHLHGFHADGKIKIIVEDQGAGFDPTEKNFGSTSRDGFGLFSIRERAELLRGQFEVQSAPGKGTRFTLEVPFIGLRVETLAEDLKKPAALQQPSIFPETRSEMIRLLLADDHTVVRRGISMLLASETDFEIIGEAEDGARAIEMARTFNPDVVLMDSSMPGVDGVEATRTIHREFPEIRIIGLSMYEEADRSKAMIDAGASAYLSKSGNSDDLIATIRRVANGKR